MFMKIKEKIEQTEFYKEEVTFNNHLLFEDNEFISKEGISIKKLFIAPIILLVSISLITLGVKNYYNKPEVHNAIEAEGNKWSQFEDSMIEDYFNILSTGEEYKLLDIVCSNESNVYLAIESSINNINHLYDEYDGLARGIQKFGSFISVNNINGVCNSMVSISINYVSEADLTEFFNAYSNDLCRYFTVYELSSENLIKELFNLLNSYEITTSEITVELPVEIKNGKFAISDDTIILELMKRSYNTSISEMIKQIKIHS